MERPKKRAKVGQAPHDVLPLDGNGDANANANVNKATSIKAKKAGANKDDDNEDEIAMDPEDYAMKIDPQYRLDRSRAVAENKLKSAFELLFEKYSRDFGDTGDEINFYTDEIEVDNGHIASLPAKGKGKGGRPRATAAAGANDDVDFDDEEEVGSDDESGSDDVPAVHPSRADASRLLSLLPPRFGPGGTLIMGSMAHTGAHQAAGSAPSNEGIDPTWMAPEIPELAFSTPGGNPPPPPPRSVYAAPQRGVFKKTLAVSHVGGLGENGDDEDDDLLLDTPNPNNKTGKRTKETPSRVASKRATLTPKTNPPTAATHTPTAPNTSSKTKKAAATGTTIGFETDQTHEEPTLPKRGRGRPKKNKVVPERLVIPNSTSPERPLSEFTSSAPLPTASEHIGGPATEATATEEEIATAPEANSSATKPKETFTRNVIDPIYAFSDEEDFGLKRRKKPQTAESLHIDILVTQPQKVTPLVQAEAADDVAPAKQTEAAGSEAPVVDDDDNVAPIPPAVEKRRPGRPRKSIGKVGTAKERAITPVRRSSRNGNLSVITMTSSSPPLPEPSPKPIAEPSAELISVKATAYTEPESDNAPDDAPDDAPEPAAEPMTATEAAITDEKAASPKDTTPDRPRKRRRHTQDTQKSATPASSARKIRRREIPDSQGNSSSGIISLVSDGSADEAELEEIAATTPPPFSPFGPPGSGVGRQPLSARRAGQTSGQTTPSGSKKPPWTPSRHRLTAASALMATPSRQQHYARALSGSPLARRQQKIILENGNVPSPGGSPIQTPGGTIRRCGKDGFRCEREFCFRCT
ncbi:hypothetical protein SBRCBS47491_007621 [Sporothrix bragantina]|uniref:Uncharacterized protein n=1 Tax=Sporothrix bragantina TaxID=671064 RepID=A0ABP0CER2_9PEZI